MICHYLAHFFQFFSNVISVCHCDKKAATFLLIDRKEILSSDHVEAKGCWRCTCQKLLPPTTLNFSLTFFLGTFLEAMTWLFYSICDGVIFPDILTSTLWPRTEIWINGDVVMFAEQSPKGRKKRKEVRKPKSWRLSYIKVSCRVSSSVLDSLGYSPLRWTLVWGSLWSNAIFSTCTRKKKRRKVVGKKRLNASNTTKESTVCQKSHFCPKIIFLTKPLWST